MTTTLFQLESRDFLEMEQALSAWDHRYRQISPGEFRGGLLHAQVGSLGIFRNRWERAIHYRGSAPKGTVAIALTLAQSGAPRWLGHRMGYDDLIVQRAGMEAEYFSGLFWDSIVVTIPETELAQSIADITDDDPQVLLRELDVARLSPRQAAQLRQAATACLKVAARSLGRQDAASTQPDMATSMTKMMARALVFSQSPTKKRSRSRQRKLVRLAEVYAARRVTQPLRIGDMCRDIRVSERSLRDAFTVQTNLSPLAYFKTQRLNRVHRALCKAETANTLIKQVAYSHGFAHLGRFCADYRRLFGESPTDTLRHG
jgi:AraC family ethanolamine operon transcriptional activator